MEMMEGGVGFDVFSTLGFGEVKYFYVGEKTLVSASFSDVLGSGEILIGDREKWTVIRATSLPS